MFNIMNDWANQIVEQAKESLDTMISETLHIDKDEKNVKEKMRNFKN